MSGVAYGDHGLVNPAGIPGADLDLVAVSTGADSIKTGGTSMKTVADDLPAKWQKLSGVYEAPESDQVFALMDPVTEDVHTIGGIARKVAAALETYASTAAGPKKQLDVLRKEAKAFVADVEDGVTRAKQVPIPKSAAEWDAYDPGKYDGETETVPWYDDPGALLQNNELVRQINEQVALLQAAQAECALAIKRAAGASVKKAYRAPSESDLNERGIDLPWSRVGTAKGKSWAEQFEDGFKDDILTTILGLTHLGGWDNSGDWSWGNLGSAWKGAAHGAVSFEMLVNPLAWGWGLLDPNGFAGRAQSEARDAASKWASGAWDNPGLALGASASVLGSAAIGPEAFGARAARAEKLLGDLDRAGQHALRSDVEKWLKSGASATDVDALHDMVTRASANQSLDPSGSSFERLLNEELARFAREHSGKQLVSQRFDPSAFLREGGVTGADARGAHVVSRHVVNPVTGTHFTWQDLRDSPKPRATAFSGATSDVDELLAGFLEHKREDIQRWLDGDDDAFIESIKFKESIGFGKVDGQMQSDIRAMTVVLVKDARSTLGYRMISAYPDGTIK
ncbi:hypothetical protein [Curtobacterium sp. MCBA15_008]|uniref:hypothetical protein n=1 Tax=Curtobacterium sp. MCBA15_008 TaxID=1898736 RepID=UPI0008DD1D36|nr:hypothetical protein [Curtobacterium sp. MCBA15_008]OII04055.1 hypothetical protein BIU96_08520 [Curtobacterium sp. MCBA15_008]